MNDISALELKEKLATAFILDVREILEFHTYNIGGLHIPLGQLPERIEELEVELDQEIIVVCQKGIRSRTAQVLLEQAGYSNVKNLRGGLSAFHRI